MLVSLTELKSYYVKNAQGEIGRVEDLCFREDEWIVRYVVVNMEDLGREALLLSADLGPAQRDTHTVAADIRRERVENTPPLDRTQPLTRRDEQELHDLYGWPVYWWEEQEEITPIEGLWDEPQEELPEAQQQEEEGPQILYASDLMEIYGIQSDDGEAGILQDVIVEDETWSIAYLVIQVQPSGPRTLLASDYIQTTDLAARRIQVAVSREALSRSPALASDEPVTPDLVRSLREYYDQYVR